MESPREACDRRYAEATDEERVIVEASRSEERKTFDREMSEMALVTMFVAYCLPDRQRSAAVKIMNEEPLTPVERGWMIREKMKILKETLIDLEKHYQIAAKYFLCHALHHGLFRWIDGGWLLHLAGRRTQQTLRENNAPRIDTISRRMIDDIERLAPPSVNLYATRLALPGRTCEEIAQVLGVVEKNRVSDVLAGVSRRRPRLADCWGFWRGERGEEETV